MKRGYIKAMLVASLFIPLAHSSAAFAQSSPPPPPPAGTPTDQLFSGFSSSIDVSTEENKAKSSFSLAGYLSTQEATPGQVRQRYDTSWKLGVSIPIGGKSDLLDKGTLASLGDGTKISAGITLLSFRPKADAIGSSGFLALMDEVRAQCVQKASDDAAKEACRNLPPAEHLIKDQTPRLTLQMNRALYSGFWTLGVEGSISTATYKFIESPNLSEKKVHQLGYSGTVTFNYYFPDAVSKFKLEAEYSDAAEAADSTIVCEPVIVNPASDCKSGSPTGPTRENALVLRTAYARYFPFRTGKAGIGIELTGSKDVLSSDWAVEAPVYLTIPGITSISPGVKFSYGSKDGKTDFTANLFVKTAFSF